MVKIKSKRVQNPEKGLYYFYSPDLKNYVNISISPHYNNEDDYSFSDFKIEINSSSFKGYLLWEKKSLREEASCKPYDKAYDIVIDKVQQLFNIYKEKTCENYKEVVETILQDGYNFVSKYKELPKDRNYALVILSTKSSQNNSNVYAIFSGSDEQIDKNLLKYVFTLENVKVYFKFVYDWASFLTLENI